MCVGAFKKRIKRTIGQTGHKVERGYITMSKDSLNTCQNKTICSLAMMINFEELQTENAMERRGGP